MYTTVSMYVATAQKKGREPTGKEGPLSKRRDFLPHYAGLALYTYSQDCVTVGNVTARLKPNPIWPDVPGDLGGV